MKAATIAGWVIWSLLLISWPVDMVFALFKESDAVPSIDRQFTAVLAGMAFLNIALSYALRWFLLRYLIAPSRIVPGSRWAVATYLVGSLIVWSFTKAVATYGLTLYFTGAPLWLYLVFWGVSLVVFLTHMPLLLDPRRVKHTAEPDTIPTEELEPNAE